MGGRELIASIVSIRVVLDQGVRLMRWLKIGGRLMEHGMHGGSNTPCDGLYTR
jgi:hypothetical protein